MSFVGRATRRVGTVVPELDEVNEPILIEFAALFVPAHAATATSLCQRGVQKTSNCSCLENGHKLLIEGRSRRVGFYASWLYQVALK
ncbi:hypothetical protein ES702_06087 [subsurface metagenome]